MQIKYFGIRHHGFGIARHLLVQLQQWQPDYILLEGPPEANELLPLVTHSNMRPPVALLAYQPDNPEQAVYYPFAEFSPEWQTLQYAQQQQIPVQFFDLPLMYSLAMQAETENKNSEDEEKSLLNNTALSIHPFDTLAEIAGFTDGEQFWETMIEQRTAGQDLFEAINHAIIALREQSPERTSEQDLIREAYMRKVIRQLEKEGKVARVAVICGAWHIPALQTKIAAKEDNARLKGLAKCKVDCTWIPWTHARLTLQSGYGAGIKSPNWYAHLWKYPDDDGVLWVSKAAQLLRRHNLDISAAYVIETVRLAQASAALRGQAKVRLNDYLEAITAVIGMGDNQLLSLIYDDFLIGNQIGSVPDETPQLPLLADVERWRKQVKLPITAESKEIILDLRKPLDLQRSLFIHRLKLLGIDWAISVRSSSKGTFKEVWKLYYQPEHHIQLIEKAILGNTLDDAVYHYVQKEIKNSDKLATLTTLLAQVMPADLPKLVSALTQRIADLSVNNQDLFDILTALPSLSESLSYSSVREFDTQELQKLLLTLLTRLSVSGVKGCMNIDAETAQQLFELIRRADYQLGLLNDARANLLWENFIHHLVQVQAVHPLLKGNGNRMEFDRQKIDLKQTALLFQQSLARPNDYIYSAYWLQGFLYQSGTILLLQQNLLMMINEWLISLTDQAFVELLPLLRRTFSTFESAECRQIGEKISQKSINNGNIIANITDIDEENVNQAMTTILALLGKTQNSKAVK